LETDMVGTRHFGNR